MIKLYILNLILEIICLAFASREGNFSAMCGWTNCILINIALLKITKNE